MDLTRLGGTEKALSGAGVLLFIFSFLPWFEVTEFGLDFRADAWAWPSGFDDWFPVLLLFGYAIVLALPAFGVAVRIPMLESAVNRALVGLALSAFAVLMFAIQGLTYPGSGFGYSAGPAWAYFISLLIALASTGRSYLGFTRQGGSLARIGAALQGRGPSAGPRPDQRVPAQPMYRPPYQGYGQPGQPPYQQPYPGQPQQPTQPGSGQPPYQGPAPQEGPQSPYPDSPPR